MKKLCICQCTSNELLAIGVGDGHFYFFEYSHFAMPEMAFPSNYLGAYTQRITLPQLYHSLICTLIPRAKAILIYLAYSVPSAGWGRYPCSDHPGGSRR